MTNPFKDELHQEKVRAEELAGQRNEAHAHLRAVLLEIRAGHMRRETLQAADRHLRAFGRGIDD